MLEADGTAAGASVHRARAFGLEIESSFEAPGLPPAAGPRDGRRTRMDLVPANVIEQRWPAREATRVLEESFDEDADSTPARTIDVHPDLGYRLYARHFGLAQVSADGASIACAPPEATAAWSWQRFLVGRILSWASVLQGYEVLHASAVSIAGAAIAFAGPTGSGKTSLALRLVAGGAGLITDDVLALELCEDTLRAHPGASVAAVRPAERALVSDSDWRRLGTVLGHSDKTYLAVPMVGHPLPLRALYFLAAGDGPAIEPISRPDPRLLLASTFVLGVQTPGRLRNQLDVCATIARDVPTFTLRVSPGLDAGALAQAVAAHQATASAR